MTKRLAIWFTVVASAMIFISTTVLMWLTHVHLYIYRGEFPSTSTAQWTAFYHHFEQALFQSAVVTALITILVSTIFSILLAKRISLPLRQMRNIAEHMKNGHWNQRVKVEGDDEIADLALSLNHLTTELQKQEEHRKNLTADLAHELRTPLTTLKNHMEAFEDGVWELTPEYMRSCQEEMDRLIFLVGDLELLTRLDAPNFRVDKKWEDISELVHSTANTWGAMFQEKEVDLDVEIEPNLYAWIDRHRMSQVLQNLLSNALKYTLSGGKVVVGLAKINQEKFQIQIKDTGIGIAEEEQPRIFERFYRVDKSRNRSLGGSGIGLTIVRKIVEAHGGNVEIQSKLGQGTKIMLKIPIHK